MIGNWNQSAGFYLLATNEITYPSHKTEIELEPVYFLDLLRINQMQHGSHLPDQEAINQFEENLENMTNEFYIAHLEPVPNDAFTIPYELGLNADRLDIISNMLATTAESAKTNPQVKKLPEFVGKIERTVRGLKYQDEHVKSQQK